MAKKRISTYFNSEIQAMLNKYSQIEDLIPIIEIISTEFLGIDPLGLGTNNFGFRLAFDYNFPLFQVFYQTRVNSGSVWSSPQEFSGTISPQDYLVFVFENHQIRLFSYYNGEIIYSNILTHTA